MKKSFFLVLVMLLVSSLAFAGADMKTFKFLPSTYTISELAPDFTSWNITPVVRIEITPEPAPCAMFIFEGVNVDRTVGVMILIFKEPSGTYIAGVMVLYRPEKGPSYVDCYEDRAYFTGGKPSFILTKVKVVGDLDLLVNIKKSQFEQGRF